MKGRTLKKIFLALYVPAAANTWLISYGLCARHGWSLFLLLPAVFFACYKAAVHETRAESTICRTKYPLIMVHGVGFRDLHFFNYWGRIPRELTRYGATVFYGNQEAFGTIAGNAEDIRKKILEVVRETGCEKVNLIAHSKGGLDSRYALSRLGMDEYTASLTTISTPHHGCRFVDYACRLPESVYRLTARYFDYGFRKFGDRNPLLTIPYCLIKPLEGDNDGLVSTESAKWGNFRGVITGSRRRGISHGDIIDLKREDYKGFDVVEEFVKIVSDLKEQGF